jgi:predicted RNA binding protein YcfA (HicA-like mRNA interferase family)
MSEKLPRVTAVVAIKALERVGFSFSRQSGSHKIYKIQKAGGPPLLIIPEKFSTQKF